MNHEVRSTRVLAKDVIVSNDTWKTGVNNNDLIVGPSGGGKTRGYVIPNILRSTDNLIVTDTKGNLCSLYGGYLEEKGYRVMHLNFSDLRKSQWGYNPLAYIRRLDDAESNRRGDYYNEQDVKKVAMAICPQQDGKEPFWDFASQMYLEVFLLYVLNCLPEEQHDLGEIYTMLSMMDDKDFRNMLDEETEAKPHSAFTRKYRMIRQNAMAEKMDASIKGVLAQHLDVVSHSETERLFHMERQVRFEDFLDGRTALFLSVSDSDRSQDALVNLFYTQAFQFLLAAADGRPDSRLPVPVRMILDDFSTNTLIPDFDNLISVIRSREIYVSLIVQSLSQLEGRYGMEKAQTIINNCDQCLYLGGIDVSTAHYFASKINCQPSTVLNLPLDSAYLFIRGDVPRKVQKYDLQEDGIYRKLMKRAEQSLAAAKTQGDTEMRPGGVSPLPFGASHVELDNQKIVGGV